MFPVSIAHIDTESPELREEMMMSTSTYACLSAMPPVSIYRQHPPPPTCHTMSPPIPVSGPTTVILRRQLATVQGYVHTPILPHATV